MVSKDDEAWRAIVDNYGDRPDLAQEDLGDEEPERRAAPPPEPARSTSWDDPFPDDDWSTDRFVPPPPPPLPRTTLDRTAAWVGVFGSPLVLLVCLVLGIDLPQLVAYGLVAAFVGGFLYLVIRMPRGPRDPGDDGAQL